jgi:NAD(P)-dependent dehydrogenase (short-subunit alcohol dehydrogenase family)
MSQPVAIVTGAGRGIGRAAAILLAERKYQLALISRSQDELLETARLCGVSPDPQNSIFRADVAKADDVSQVVKKVIARFGRVDAVVHCAGYVKQRGIEELTLDEWRQTVDVNLSAAIYFSRLLWPTWRKQGGGVLVNVSSYAARDPFTGLGAYGAAKAGINLLGIALAREGAPINVRVHTVAPAATETAMFRSLFAEEQYSKDKTLDPAEVARVIVQCVCGDLACTSGEVIYVHKNA